MFLDYMNSSASFVIAEVGQNHQGDLELAREYIRIFAMAGADAVKFQTRNNKVLFAEDAYNSSYESENAFASTYGAHREYLELKPEWLPILKEDCNKYGVKFMSTPFDEPSLELLLTVDVDILKIASFDLGNLPFIKLIAESGKPVVMSIGGGKSEQIRSSVDILLEHDCDLAILHCVSEYPCEFNRLGLNNIEKLIKEFPRCAIGLSDHFSGILSGPIAFMKGARIFEKHVTLNRSWKGTDHGFALEPEGFRKLARDIRRTPQMMEPKSDVDLGSEAVFKKLGKSLTARCDIEAGEALTLANLSSKIFKEQFIPVRESNKVMEKKATKRLLKGDPIQFSDLVD